MKYLFLLVTLATIITNAYGSGNSFSTEEPTKKINVRKLPTRIKIDDENPPVIISEKNDDDEAITGQKRSADKKLKTPTNKKKKEIKP